MIIAIFTTGDSIAWDSIVPDKSDLNSLSANPDSDAGIGLDTISLNTEANPNTIKLDTTGPDDLTVEPSAMDSTVIKDETSLNDACVDEQTPGSVHRRETEFCTTDDRSTTGIAAPPEAPGKIKIPDVFVVPKTPPAVLKTPPGGTDNDDEKKKICPKKYDEHVCCQGPEELPRFRHGIGGYWFFGHVGDCVRCEYFYFFAVSDVSSNTCERCRYSFVRRGQKLLLLVFSRPIGM